MFHGSARKVKHPAYGIGNPNNDYGLGFYTTELKELAFEWACPRANDGWANEYVLDTRGLSIVDLNADCYTVLNWMAVLLEHRKVSMSAGIAREAHDFIVKEYAVDLTGADLVHGYRADDSYFNYSLGFVRGEVSLETLAKAMKLGRLGLQYVLVSKKAFSRIEYVSSHEVPHREDYKSFREKTLGEYHELLRQENRFANTFIGELMKKYGE